MGFLKKLFSKPGNVICAPASGNVVPLSEVHDPVFSSEMMGKGVAIIPDSGKIFAPCDATVDMMFDTGHAVSLVAQSGAEILIHVGLDTVNLHGEHYTVHAKNGEQVKLGQLLISFDPDAIRAAGYDTITPVVICNSGDYTTFDARTGVHVTPGEELIKLAK